MPKKAKKRNGLLKVIRSQADMDKAVKGNHRALLRDLRKLIASSRQDAARQVNTTLVLLYWRIGKRILQDILKRKRAGYRVTKSVL